ncbi:hypothetical protein [Shewanella frigidimarina]|uniref:Uncharacterized protein n=1 Tax=Shewanella frigidimarina TaxID=56812 RepID=A0A119D0K5_SHEFR|nr:hypothetical protein [Shewanella frigidimarina]KVX03054.1 hypothetical protein AWJ07_00290 [Shewanella frigidimarina]
MDSGSESLKIHDDNHARAVLKNEMRLAREYFIKTNSSVINQYRKKRKFNHDKTLFEMICKINDQALKKSLIYKVVKNNSVRGGSVDYISLGWINIDDEGVTMLKDERLYPVSFQAVDIKSISLLNRDGTHEGTIRIMFYLTEHALVRLMRRYYRYDLRSLTDIISEELQPRLFTNQINAQQGDFVIITGNAYVPCTHHADGVPILKTWIPRTVWTDHNESKLSSLCNFLNERNEIRIFSDQVFDDSVYFPAQ